MKIRDLIRQAVEKQDAAAAGQVAEFCRFKAGLNYRETFDLVHRRSPSISLAQWDALLYEDG